MKSGKRYTYVVLVSLLSLGGCDDKATNDTKGPTKSQSELSVTLTPDEVRDLGIRTVTAIHANYTETALAYGVVNNFDALSQADASVLTAEAAVRQSQASVARMRRLQVTNAISRDALDLAEKQAATDLAQLAMAERQEASTFGRSAPWLDPSKHAEVLAKLTSGRAKLVHVSFPIGSLPGAGPAELTISRVDHAPGTPEWRTSTVWEAPADTTIPGRGFYALVEQTNLTEGERVLAAAPLGRSIEGVLVSGDAIIVSQSQTWCYVRTGPGIFARKIVDISRPMSGGYFVSNGIKPGDSIVVAGQGMLLAHEISPAPSAGD